VSAPCPLRIRSGETYEKLWQPLDDSANDSLHSRTTRSSPQGQMSKQFYRRVRLQAMWLEGRSRGWYCRGLRRVPRIDALGAEDPRVLDSPAGPLE